MRGRTFQKGVSGNPGGRPKAVEEVRELARRHCADAIAELARLAVKAKSEAARIAAIRELLDRGYGKATQGVELSRNDGAPIEIVTDETRQGVGGVYRTDALGHEVSATGYFDFSTARPDTSKNPPSCGGRC